MRALGRKSPGTNPPTAATTPVMTPAAARKTNTEPNQKNSTSPPAMTMPIVPPSAALAVHRPIARPRLSRGMVAVRVARVPGKISAAPTPPRARDAINDARSFASAPHAAAATKIANPASMIRRLPNRSPSAPIGSRSAAKVTANASTTHCNSVCVGWSSPADSGKYRAQGKQPRR